MNITILDGFTLNPGDLSWSEMKTLGIVTIYERTKPDEILKRSKNAEAIFTNKVIINREIIEQLPDLKFIGVLATGYNVVDVEAARRSGITVTNIPAYSTASVAQMVFAHILNFTQRVGLHSMEVGNGKWTKNPDFCFWNTPQTELAGKTLGIIGFGRIGQAVATIGHAFGMKVIFHNRSIKINIPEWFEQTGQETVFRNSDYISINCPLTTNNTEFVNCSMLGLMKPTAFLVNTGRGALVSEKDLADALNLGSIAGAGLDVLSTEPPLADNLLLTAKNCFITPHIAWATFEARTRLMEIATENLKAFVNGIPQNVVH